MDAVTKYNSKSSDNLIARILTLLNFGIVAYFSFMYLIYVFKITHVLLGVVNEMFTFPFMFLQLVFLVIGIIYLFIKPVNYLFIGSLALLTICAVLTLGGFFY